MRLLCGKLNTTPLTFLRVVISRKDWVVGDKGYSFSRNRVYNLLTPLRASREDEWSRDTLNSINACFTRQITAIRNVVEHVIGQLKMQWKRLAGCMNLRDVVKLHKVMPILAAIRNIFFKPLRYH